MWKGLGDSAALIFYGKTMTTLNLYYGLLAPSAVFDDAAANYGKTSNKAKSDDMSGLQTSAPTATPAPTEAPATTDGEPVIMFQDIPWESSREEVLRMLMKTDYLDAQHEKLITEWGKPYGVYLRSSPEKDGSSVRIERRGLDEYDADRVYLAFPAAGKGWDKKLAGYEIWSWHATFVVEGSESRLLSFRFQLNMNNDREAVADLSGKLSALYGEADYIKGSVDDGNQKLAWLGAGDSCVYLEQSSGTILLYFGTLRAQDILENAYAATNGVSGSDMEGLGSVGATAPAPTMAPAVTETPAATEVPVVTEEPTATEAPAATEVPAPTVTPTPTEALVQDGADMVDRPLYDGEIQFAEFTFGDTFGEIRYHTNVNDLWMGDNRIYTVRAFCDLAGQAVANEYGEAEYKSFFKATVDVFERRVAGYQPWTNLYFMYPIVDGQRVIDENQAVFVMGEYEFMDDASYKDLLEKLTAKYGEPWMQTDNGIDIWGNVQEEENYREIMNWYSDVCYTVWKSSVNNAMVVLKYYREGGEERLFLAYACFDMDEDIITLVKADEAGSAPETSSDDGMEGL